MKSNNLPPTFVTEFHSANEVSKMPYHKFGDTSMYVSFMSIGTGGFSSIYGDFSIEECKKTIVQALRYGINFIDTAPWYGQGLSERILGLCLREVPRNAYYLATKVGRYEKDPQRMFDFSAKKTQQSIKESLERLGIDYIDLIQIHDVEFAPSPSVILNETLPILQEYIKSGIVKFIGITGYSVSILADYILKSQIRIDSILSYTRLSLLDQTLEQYISIFNSKKIGIINAAANCMGLLTSTGPPTWHPATENIKQACTEARQYCTDLNIELAKLALHYSLQQSGPHTHLIGMNTIQLLNENLDVLWNGLDKSELEAMEYVSQNIMGNLHTTHWEQIEVEAYWKALNTASGSHSN